MNQLVITAVWLAIHCSCSTPPSLHSSQDVADKHKPSNVSDIRQQTDPSDPGSFACGEPIEAQDATLYFVATGNLVKAGYGTSNAHRIYTYRHAWEKLDHDKRTPPVDDASLGNPDAPKPRHLAVARTDGGTDFLVFARGTEMLRWNASYKKLTQSTGPALQNIHAIRARGTRCLILANTSTDAQQLFTVDLAKDTFALVPNSAVVAQSAAAFEFARTGDDVAWLASSNAGDALWIWTAQGLLPPFPLANPRFLHGGAGGFYVAAASNDADVVYRATTTLQEIAAPLGTKFTNVHGITTQIDSSGNLTEWVLASHGSPPKTSMYYRSLNSLVHAKDFDGVNPDAQPRGLVPLGTGLGFLTGDRLCWQYKSDQPAPYSAESPVAAPNSLIATLFPFDGQAVFAGSGKSVQPPTEQLGSELWRWYFH